MCLSGLDCLSMCSLCSLPLNSVWAISYLSHILSEPYPIWAISYLSHILTEPYPIWAISYLSHILSESYLIWAISYLNHILSESYPIWVISYLSHILSSTLGLHDSRLVYQKWNKLYNGCMPYIMDAYQNVVSWSFLPSFLITSLPECGVLIIPSFIGIINDTHPWHHSPVIEWKNVPTCWSCLHWRMSRA